LASLKVLEKLHTAVGRHSSSCVIIATGFVRTATNIRKTRAQCDDMS